MLNTGTFVFLPIAYIALSYSGSQFLCVTVAFSVLVHMFIMPLYDIA